VIVMSRQFSSRRRSRRWATSHCRPISDVNGRGIVVDWPKRLRRSPVPTPAPGVCALGRRMRFGGSDDRPSPGLPIEARYRPSSAAETQNDRPRLVAARRPLRIARRTVRSLIPRSAAASRADWAPAGGKPSGGPSGATEIRWSSDCSMPNHDRRGLRPGRPLSRCPRNHHIGLIRMITDGATLRR
jgi:hypothetical protein